MSGPRALLRGPWTLALTLLLWSCASSHPPSADDIHRQFVEAIRQNDQPTVTRFVAPDARMNVGSIPERAYADTVNPDFQIGYRPAGKFLRVDVLPVKQAGSGTVGRSVWRWEQGAACYTTTPAQEPEGWQARSFYVDLHGCMPEELR